MEQFRTLTTKEKALKINLDENIYGSFAEIGAGQEVAAHFFKAGGASGTVAKTMSAYDMAFSDAIYGKTRRYVSQERLDLMLEKEYNLLPKRLPQRADTTRFFAYANTVEALNFKRTNQGHGWMGLRFQLSPKAPYNECIIHLVLTDNDTIQQQQALGVVGVNLLYACFNERDPDALVNALTQNLMPGRVEIDMFRIHGPEFYHVDNRLMALKLVKNGLTKAAVFGSDGEVLQPSSALYKKNVLLLRGRFRPITHVNLDMLTKGMDMFQQEEDVDAENIELLTELTLNDLQKDGEIDDQDFLDRADLLCSLGHHVLISNYYEHYRLVRYMSRFTKGNKLGIILGLHNLEKIFEENHYTHLAGGILESFGILFGDNVKLYVYPALETNGNKLLTLDDFQVEANLKNLFQYLCDNGKIQELHDVNKEILHIISDNVLDMIRADEQGWEEYVPWIVADAIKKNCLFNYPCEVDDESQMALKASSATNG